MGKGVQGQTDWVLESRQLLLVFFAIVALCGVFFSLGYIVGHNTLSETTSSAQAAVAASAPGVKPSPMPPATYLNRPPTETEATPDPAVPPGTDLSFYQSAEEPAEPATTLTESSQTPANSATASPAIQIAPAPPPGMLVQVSALTRQEDAESLVQLLKEKNLPVMVTSGAGDSLFHVVVGPYQNEMEAQRVRALLEQDGFRPFIKR
ncbi:MAG: SPOR domain-containing protein [Acidobacteria bacterium]|nr:SPOR domain-containing protein [Acidobacteriota bacterium]